MSMVDTGYLYALMIDAGLPISGVGLNPDGTPRIDWLTPPPSQADLDSANAIITAYDPAATEANWNAEELALKDAVLATGYVGGPWDATNNTFKFLVLKYVARYLNVVDRDFIVNPPAKWTHPPDSPGGSGL